MGINSFNPIFHEFSEASSWSTGFTEVPERLQWLWVNLPVHQPSFLFSFTTNLSSYILRKIHVPCFLAGLAVETQFTDEFKPLEICEGVFGGINSGTGLPLSKQRQMPVWIAQTDSGGGDTFHG